MSIDIISIILTRDHRSDPSRPWLQTSTAFMPTHSTISFHHSSPVIVGFRTNRRFVCTKLHSIALDWNGEMDTVFSCCWVHMSVYDSVSASFIGKILHVPNEDGNEDDPYAVSDCRL